MNFQSWLDPFIIITALPAALAGIVLCLFFTGTTLSVPALMGAIMCMGVATANSILMVSFARERLAEHGDAVRAAIEAGFTRFRPVLMTALAMIIGMVPMALGARRRRRAERAARPGGDRRPLLATVATLVFVPAVFPAARTGARTAGVAPTGAHKELAPAGGPSGTPRRRTRGRLPAAMAGMLAVAIAARWRPIGNGIAERADARRRGDRPRRCDAGRDAVHRTDAPDQALVLPGQTMAFIDTPIYARTSGYLKRWNFDIGAHVRQGDLLAQIETPELDQQLRQARAQLVQTQAALDAVPGKHGTCQGDE